MRAYFVYAAAVDHHVCPAGAVLMKAAACDDRHRDIDHYRILDACHACEVRALRTPKKVKHMKRWKHEAVLEAIHKRLDAIPDATVVRRATVE